MADAYGNVVAAPGASVKPYLNDLELLFSYARLVQFGCTIKLGQGVLPIGTPLEVDSATGQYVKSATNSTITKGFLRTAVDSGLAVLTPSSSLAVSDTTGGGSQTFAASEGPYFWVITFTNGYGETNGSNEVTLTLTALDDSAHLTWSAAPTGTVNINVYRGTVSGQENTLVAVLAGTATSYTDTGLYGEPGKPPISNSSAPPVQQKLGNIVIGGLVRKDLVEMANGGALTSSQLTALGNARVDADFGFIEF